MANDNWQLKAVLSAVDRMSPVLKQVAATAKNTRKYLGDVAASAGKLGTHFGLPIAALSGMLTGLTVGAVKKAVVGFTEMSEEIKKGALQAGMSTDEYQRMSYVAMQAGVGVEALGGALGMLNRKMGDANAGKNKSVANLFKRLGIDINDAKVKAEGGIAVLPQLADAFERNEGQLVRARMGAALFGKKWQEIIPLLAEGGTEIEKSLKRFGLLKGVISKEDLDAGRELGRMFNDLSVVLKGFSGAIAKQLIPVLTPMLNGLVLWISVNKKLIANNITKVTKDFVKFINAVDWKKSIEGVLGLVGGLGALALYFAKNTTALIAWVAFLNVQSIVALASVVRALGVAIAATAIWIAEQYVAANATMLSTVRMAYMAVVLRGGVIASLVAAGRAFLLMAGQAVIASAAAVVSMVRVAISAVATLGPIGAIGAAFAAMAGIVAGAGGVISGALAVVGGALRAVGVAMMANPLGVVLGLAAAALLIYQNWGTLKEWFSSFFDWIGNKFKSLIGWALDLAKTARGFFGGGDTTVSGAPAGAPSGAGWMPSAAVPAYAQDAAQSLVVPAPAAMPAPGFAAASPRQPLLGQPATARLDGRIKVDFTNMPTGARVEQDKGGSMPISLNVGYSSASLGGAF